MIIEAKLIEVFRERGITLYHKVPTSVPKPYILYDRLNGELNVYPGYDRYEFAFDIYSKTVSSALETLTDIDDIVQDLELNDGHFSRIEIYNSIDNSINEEVIYSVYLRILYRKAIKN